ncbi:MAG: CBS domain-containing protein [Planctomycetaceae bacterium]|nr:CBS domain-containing protein [Planctomycetaceae bacterium]
MSRLKRESVTHIMTKSLQTITIRTPLSEVGRIFTESSFHHLPVVSGDKLVGIISFVDLMRVSFADSFGVTAQQAVYEVLDRTLSVESVMTKDPVTIDSSQTIQDAAEKLADGAFHALPVVGNDNELLGMVTSADLIRYLIAQY